jgi:NAD(P)-dependent dehydrogenase (short-subunit alcohol dehydrogenase family)
MLTSPLSANIADKGEVSSLSAVRSVLVTGSSTGIGRSTALRLDREGWRVFAGVRRDEDAESLRSAASDRLVPVKLDVTDQAQIAAAGGLIEDAVGEGGLDGLVNNAGVAILGPLETIPLDDFRRQIEVNLTAQVAVTQAILPLIRRGHGRIVFVSSIGGRMALPFGGPYHAAKFGLEAVADCLRQELRPWKIAVAVIEPGSINTPIWERGERIADDVATRAPSAQQELYGEAIERFRKAVRRTAERGIAPEKVAGAIAQALSVRRPRTRYLVGADARGQVLARRLLPDRALDRIVARIMRSQSNNA